MLTRRQLLIAAAVSPIAQFCRTEPAGVGSDMLWIDESFDRPKLDGIIGYAVEDSTVDADGNHFVRVQLVPNTTGMTLTPGRRIALPPGTLG